MKFTYLLPLLLIGCGGLQVPKTVNIPVQISCVKEIPAKPVYTFESTKGKERAERVKALLIDRENSIPYEAALEAIVDSCK